VAKADVLQLVTDFGVSDVDQDEISIYHDEIVRELGFREVLTGTETIPVTAGTPEYALADDTIRALEVHLASGRIDPNSIQALQSVLGVNWRNQSGSVLAYTSDEQDDDDIRLVPIPAQNDTLTIIRTETRTNLPVWLELPVALEILHREYQRESDHQDVAFAEHAHLMSVALFTLVGVV
jgi:hypothetical protein